MACEIPPSALTLPSVSTFPPIELKRETEFQLPASILASLQRFDRTLQDLTQQEGVLTSRLHTISEDLLQLRVRALELAAEAIKRPRSLPATEKSSKDRRWCLRALTTLPSAICKGKYFELAIRLEPLADVQLSEDFVLSLSVCLFRSDSPLEPILLNMSGRPIIRGDEKGNLVYDPMEKTHVARFRLQITEVTSHYVNGWVRLSISPAPDSPFSDLIEPFILDRVVVRAKEKTCKIYLERQLAGKRQPRLRNFPSQSP